MIEEYIRYKNTLLGIKSNGLWGVKNVKTFIKCLKKRKRVDRIMYTRNGEYYITVKSYITSISYREYPETIEINFLDYKKPKIRKLNP